jgi:hypothetical protein
MNELDFRAKAIVDAGRNADDPSPADRARIKHAILLQVAGGVAGGAAATAVAGTSVGLKVGLTVLAVSLVGGGTLGVLKVRSSHKAALERKAHVVVAQASSPVPPPLLPSESAQASIEPSVALPLENKIRRVDKTRRPTSPMAKEPSAVEDQLNAEVAVLKHAREELRMGRPARALEALAEYDRRFGRGTLGEERQALAAIAACQAHPGQAARAAAEDFMHKAPSSPLIDRVRAACITSARNDSR